MNTTVNVVIPVNNSYVYLHEPLASLWQQICEGFELLAIDDD